LVVLGNWYQEWDAEGLPQLRVVELPSSNTKYCDIEKYCGRNNADVDLTT